ncbi:hypothetical protein [Streptomyces sp. SS]|uniref:hypothetical protein n=1 Tax=Streptomyces sp. SS TaxID=260742 RepID=UPI0002EC9762|nr:hypothetical protein [Streptomyces sp. SS]
MEPRTAGCRQGDPAGYGASLDTGTEAGTEGAAPTGEFELTDEWPVPPLCLSAVTTTRSRDPSWSS